MNKPSVKTLNRAFPGKGRVLRELLTSEKAVRVHPAAVELDRRCLNAPSLAQLRLAALNEETDCHGVEYVAEGSNARSPAFEYLNTGDSYTPTIVRFHGGRYVVADVGTIIEHGNYA